MDKHRSLPVETEVLLGEYGIRLMDIARRARVDVALVATALDPNAVARCPVIVLLKVRTALQSQLQELGWRGDRHLLWGDFDALLEREARKR